MKKIILIFVLITSTLSCSKKDDNTDDTAYNGSFNGLFINYGNSSKVMGGIMVENNGKITIDLLAGRLIGSAEKTNDGFNISILEVEGIFQNISNLSGSLNTSQERLSINGKNLDGSSVTIDGEVVMYITNDGYLGDALKTAVYFTHDTEDAIASVTINGVTLSGLQQHYSENGFCNPLYNGWFEIPQNNDDKESQIFCYSGTLVGLDGNPLPFTSCNVIGFILDKSTDYSYTVNWSNGETYTREITTGLGGTNLVVCLEGGGNGGGNGGGEFIDFSFQGVNYSMTFISQYIRNICSSNNNWLYENVHMEIQLNNIPSQSSGMFQMTDGTDECSTFLWFAFDYNYYISKYGTITKTGARSFDFSANISTHNGNEEFLISGSGVYTRNE